MIPFENMWVALTPDRRVVIASGRTIKELEKKVIKLGITKPFLLRFFLLVNFIHLNVNEICF